MPTIEYFRFITEAHNDLYTAKASILQLRKTIYTFNLEKEIDENRLSEPIRQSEILNQDY